MTALQLYYGPDDDWREIEMAARAALPADSRYKVFIIMTPISQKPKHKKQDEQQMTPEQKKAILDGTAVVVGVLMALNLDLIEISILNGQPNEAVTETMRGAFWQAVSATGTTPEQFKMIARQAVKCKLLDIERGSCSCGGAAGYDFLIIPPDFNERVKQFMAPVKQRKGKPMPAVFRLARTPEPEQRRVMPEQPGLFA